MEFRWRKMMSKRSSRIVSFSLVLILFITPMVVLAQGEPPTIEGIVFNDVNQNGVFDAGETGITDVTVDLLEADGVTVIDSVDTDGGGLYSFTELNLGDYVVKENDPDDHVSTSSNKVAVTLTDAVPVVIVDFGDAAYIDLGQISGFVYDDADRDGEFDPGEATISGVAVNLFGFDGEVIETATTDLTTGEYTLTMALAGANTVQEIDLPPYLSVTPNIVEVTLENPGDTIDEVNFFDFIPEEGEFPRLDLMLMKFFDISLLEFQALRDMEGWGYGNIAKAYFIAQLSDTALVDILGLRETMGWGKVMKEILGYAGLKGVSGRTVPNSIQRLIDSCASIDTPEQVQELYATGANHGSIKKACRLTSEAGGNFDTLVTALGLLKVHSQKQVREMLMTCCKRASG
jgi:hypothetical protein